MLAAILCWRTKHLDVNKIQNTIAINICITQKLNIEFYYFVETWNEMELWKKEVSSCALGQKYFYYNHMQSHDERRYLLDLRCKWIFMMKEFKWKCWSLGAFSQNVQQLKLQFSSPSIIMKTCRWNVVHSAKQNTKSRARKLLMT